MLQGLCSSPEGPALPELEFILDTSIKGLSLGLSANSLGYLIGSVLCGVLFDRLSQDFQLALSTLIMGVMAALPAYSGGLWGFIAVMFVKGVAMGYISTGNDFYIDNLLFVSNTSRQIF